MKQNNLNAEQLRQEDESRLYRRTPSFVQPLPGENLLHELMHELRVSQIELEMQNETLRRSQIELEASRDRYVDFYDFALVSYLTLDREATIKDINLPGAELLGVERKLLMRRRFASFVLPADQDLWHHHFISVLKSDHKRHCELALQKGDGTFAKVILICQRLKKSGQEMMLRIVLVDMTEITPVEAADNEHRLNQNGIG